MSYTKVKQIQVKASNKIKMFSQIRSKTVQFANQSKYKVSGMFGVSTTCLATAYCLFPSDKPISKVKHAPQQISYNTIMGPRVESGNKAPPLHIIFKPCELQCRPERPVPQPTLEKIEKPCPEPLLPPCQNGINWKLSK